MTLTCVAALAVVDLGSIVASNRQLLDSPALQTGVLLGISAFGTLGLLAMGAMLSQARPILSRALLPLGVVAALGGILLALVLSLTGGNSLLVVVLGLISAATAGVLLEPAR